MTVIISMEDVSQATMLLSETYTISVQLLHEIFPNEWHKTFEAVNKALYNSKKSSYASLKGDVFFRLVVIEEGYNLFSGSQKRKLRKTILEQLSEEKVNELYEMFCQIGNCTTKSTQTKPLSELKWVNGKRWAKAFVRAAGFPIAFAGMPQASDKSCTIESVPPKKPDIQLKPFQVELKKRMEEVLSLKQDKTKCIVTLPTGCGKTRIAVEAFIDWMQPRFSEGRYLIWIAQSEELCDQAAECIKEIWGQKEFVEDLTLIRFYNSSKLKLSDIEDGEYPEGGVVVASIQQLHKRLEKNDSALLYVLEKTGAVIIDEAHRAVTSMYEGLFDAAKKVCSKDLFAICGLTATPGRSTIGENDTKKLVNQFEATLIRPSLENDSDYDANNPLKYFKKHGYLARSTLEVIKNHTSFKCDEKELDKLRMAIKNNDKLYELDAQKGHKLLKQLAMDVERNNKIINRLLELPKTSRTLVYTCTVEHAKYLSSMMNLLGRESCAVTAGTPTTERRRIIKEFKEGEIQFIFNYGVLTTGFDAPKTDTIVLCRPILSDILYEQIIGRGMRGPEFNGTERCLIIDFEDTISNFGLPLAYHRYEDYWDEIKQSNEPHLTTKRE